MLFWTREEFQTFRVDVDVLFGRELIGRGHEIDLVMESPDASIAAGEYPWYGRKVFVGRPSGRGLWGRLTRHPRVFLHDLRMLLRPATRAYGALQFRDKFLIAAIGVLVARRRRQKCFYWLSFPYPEDDLLRASTGQSRFPALVRLRGRLTAWLLYRWILPRVDHAFVQSERMREDIAAQGVPRDRMTPVPMGIDLADTPRLTRRAAPAPGEDWVLGYLGTLSADRHVVTLVDMLDQLRRAGEPVRLLMIGDAFEAADRRLIESRAAARGLTPWLQITGSLPRAEAIARMAAVDIALSPYYPSPLLQSTSPTKLVEYLALGVPVVASEHPEQRAILRASKAGLCTPWGARHFARGVRWLMRRGEAELAGMGDRGRAWVVNHRTYSGIADRLEREYRRLIVADAPPVLRSLDPMG